MGDMREPENVKEAFLIVWTPAILLSNSAVSYWLGAKATRTWQLLTMLSFGTVLVDDLANVLGDEVSLQSKTCHIRECVGKDFHTLE